MRGLQNELRDRMLVSESDYHRGDLPSPAAQLRRGAEAGEQPSAGRHPGNGLAFCWQTVPGGGRAPVNR
jgi:hypothetical protein